MNRANTSSPNALPCNPIRFSPNRLNPNFTVLVPQRFSLELRRTACAQLAEPYADGVQGNRLNRLLRDATVTFRFNCDVELELA